MVIEKCAYLGIRKVQIKRTTDQPLNWYSANKKHVATKKNDYCQTAELVSCNILPQCTYDILHQSLPFSFWATRDFWRLHWSFIGNPDERDNDAQLGTHQGDHYWKVPGANTMLIRNLHNSFYTWPALWKSSTRKLDLKSNALTDRTSAPWLSPVFHCLRTINDCA